MSKERDRKIDEAVGTDINIQIQQVLRESYQENAECLREFTQKMRDMNRRKRAIREYLSDLRAYHTSVMSTARESGVDLCRGDENDLALIAKAFKEHAHTYEIGEVEYELCIPNRVPPAEVNSIEQLKYEITRWEEVLVTIGEDAQLAQIDIQNWTQKTQSALAMLSNFSKLSHDSIMAIIRNIGS